MTNPYESPQEIGNSLPQRNAKLLLQLWSIPFLIANTAVGIYIYYLHIRATLRPDLTFLQFLQVGSLLTYVSWVVRDVVAFVIIRFRWFKYLISILALIEIATVAWKFYTQDPPSVPLLIQVSLTITSSLLLFLTPLAKRAYERGGTGA